MLQKIKIYAGHKMKNILITGATGYLGSSLTNRLNGLFSTIIIKNKSSDISRITNSINNCRVYDTDNSDFLEIFSENKIDYIIHTATAYGRRGESNPEIIKSNILFPLKLMELAKQHNVKAFINTDTVLPKFTNSYSLSKNHFRDWLMMINENMQIVNCRLEHFYGPGDSSSKFVTGMIKKMISNEKKIQLTKGEQVRDFIFIDDVVNAFIVILDNIENLKNAFMEFQIGSSKGICIKDLIILIKELVKSSSSLHFGSIPYRDNEMMQSTADIKELQKLGWEPVVTLEEGLKQTIEFESQSK
jgi:CDP-paratose synthetase